jgi:hypothetical protein
MSAGGVFKLIANDGKPDRLLVATALLNQRIKDVVCARRAAGKEATPTLLDIERTHILFVNAHFKPFAAVGYEYNKVRPNSGTSTFAGTVQFSIPQFGDFFHDMVLHAVFSETYADAKTAPTPSTTVRTAAPGAYGLTNIIPLTADIATATSVSTTPGTDWAATALVAGATAAIPGEYYEYSLVDAFGTPVAPAATYRNMVRYVEFPAERFASKVKFDVNGNPLDEYTHRAASMLRKFTVSDEKLVGYKRLVGQEVPIEGFSGPRVCAVQDTDYLTTMAPNDAASHGVTAGLASGSVQNQGKSPAGYMVGPRHAGGDFAANQWQNNAGNDVTPSAATASVPVNVGLGTAQTTDVTGGVGPSEAAWGHVQRACLSAVDGPQTPKYWQPPLEIWDQLQFWFNKDARLSIPSVAIPYGQRFITIDTAAADEMIVDFPGLFVQQTVSNLAQFSISAQAAADAATADNSAGTTFRSYRPYWVRSTIHAPTISTLELYINNIFVNPEVHDIFIRRVGFSLIRVFRTHISQKNQGEDQELLSQLKWPIECLFVGYQPTANIAKAANPNYHRDWHRMGKTFDSICELRSQTMTGMWVAKGAAATVKLTQTSSLGQIIPDTYVVERPTVTSLSLTAHGIKLYDSFPQAFFASYEPFHYGGSAIRPSTDAGAMMINFALFMGCYQPSGYLNTSRARELYLSHVSAFIGSTTPVTLIGIAIAINFLLITDGSAVLRYST